LAEKLVSANVEAYLSYFYTSTAYNYSPAIFSKEDIAEYVRVYSAPGALRAGFQYYRTGLQEDLENLSNCTRKLTMPVLAWGGEVFLGNIVPAWQAVAENVQGGEVKQCGHFIAEEKPEFTIQQALEFFGPLQKRS
ncbi:MAG: alpha/beta hydrolase, partial [Elusimicrobia bacterium]|nr:alpha/beta hydrolase [Elusimicrobiota bacterium]